MYKLSLNSLTSKFYSWIWNTNVTKFRNMCPYFWRYVATIIFLPLILPVRLLMGATETVTLKSSKLDKVYDTVVHSKPLNYFNRFFKWTVSFDRFWYTIEKFIKWIFITIFIALIAFSFVGLIYLFYQDPMKFLEGLALSIGVMITLWVIIYLFTEKHLGRILWTPFKLCGNMIYNLYKNVCPIITWDK